MVSYEFDFALFVSASFLVGDRAFVHVRTYY